MTTGTRMSLFSLSKLMFCDVLHFHRFSKSLLPSLKFFNQVLKQKVSYPCDAPPFSLPSVTWLHIEQIPRIRQLINLDQLSDGSNEAFECRRHRGGKKRARFNHMLRAKRWESQMKVEGVRKGDTSDRGKDSKRIKPITIADRERRKRHIEMRIENEARKAARQKRMEEKLQETAKLPS